MKGAEQAVNLIRFCGEHFQHSQPPVTCPDGFPMGMLQRIQRFLGIPCIQQREAAVNGRHAEPGLAQQINDLETVNFL